MINNQNKHQGLLESQENYILNQVNNQQNLLINNPLFQRQWQPQYNIWPQIYQPAIIINPLISMNRHPICINSFDQQQQINQLKQNRNQELEPKQMFNKQVIEKQNQNQQNFISQMNEEMKNDLNVNMKELNQSKQQNFKLNQGKGKGKNKQKQQYQEQQQLINLSPYQQLELISKILKIDDKNQIILEMKEEMDYTDLNQEQIQLIQENQFIIAKYINQETLKQVHIFVCMYEGCHQHFNRLEFILNHMRTHTMPTPFECPHQNCNRRFSQKCNLKKHMKLHFNKQKLICKICFKQFRLRDELIIHFPVCSKENKQVL